MKIRLSLQKDLSQLTEIYNQAIVRKSCTADTETFTTEERQVFFDAHQNKQYPLYVYEVENKIAGYVYISAYRPGRKAMAGTVEISYYVHNDYQGQGIGTQLLDFALEKAKDLNYKTAVAILLSINTASIALLEKFKFQQWGCLPQIAEFDSVTCDHLYYGLKL